MWLKFRNRWRDRVEEWRYKDLQDCGKRIMQARVNLRLFDEAKRHMRSKTYLGVDWELVDLSPLDVLRKKLEGAKVVTAIRQSRVEELEAMIRRAEALQASERT